MNDLLAKVGGRSHEQDIEMGGMDMDAGAGGQDTFFDQIKIIKQKMQEINKLYTKIEASNEYSKAITKSTDMKACRDEMHNDITRANGIAAGVKKQIEKLQQETKRLEPGSADERVQSNLITTQMKNFKAQMSDFNKLREKIQQEYREVVERRYFTINGKRAPEDDIDKMIETGESETLFQKAILEQGRGRVLDTLAEIDERHAAVKDLERSMLEMHQMFLDMAVLVEEQGAQLNNIQNQVERAKTFVASGTKQLEYARQSQKSTRKWACIGMLILLLVVAIIVGVVVVQVRN